ncbi:MAG: sulfate adenylyltransferase, partial [Corynebacterium camporealensis]|uniref:elongation factor 1-alpha C-terminal domain-related protein n=1 Tax=Corynebacterium camporealensis TaxID=161896 RepID=UPI002A910267
ARITWRTPRSAATLRWRHLNVAALLGVRHVILAVNKIDLVDYDEQTFRAIETEFKQAAERLGIDDCVAVPISALRGDNVVERSTVMDWYTGPTVLELLETIPVHTGRADDLDFRFPIQYVIREHASDFRGYAGQVKAGSIAVGDKVTLPHGRTSTVTHIDGTDGEYTDGQRAGVGESVVLRLADDIDLARGDLIAGEQRPEEVRDFDATLVGLTEKPLRAGQMLKLRYGTSLVKARVSEVVRTLDLDGVADVEAPDEVALNDIAYVRLQTQAELPVENYAARGAVGNFLLVDQGSGDTLAAGLVGHRLR